MTDDYTAELFHARHYYRDAGKRRELRRVQLGAIPEWDTARRYRAQRRYDRAHLVWVELGKDLEIYYRLSKEGTDK